MADLQVPHTSIVWKKRKEHGCIYATSSRERSGCGHLFRVSGVKVSGLSQGLGLGYGTTTLSIMLQQCHSDHGETAKSSAKLLRRESEEQLKANS